MPLEIFKGGNYLVTIGPRGGAIYDPEFEAVITYGGDSSPSAMITGFSNTGKKKFVESDRVDLGRGVGLTVYAPVNDIIQTSNIFDKIKEKVTSSKQGKSAIFTAVRV